MLKSGWTKTTETSLQIFHLIHLFNLLHSFFQRATKTLPYFLSVFKTENFSEANHAKMAQKNTAMRMIDKSKIAALTTKFKTD